MNTESITKTFVQEKILLCSFVFVVIYITLITSGECVLAHSLANKIFEWPGDNYGICFLKTAENKIIVAGITSAKTFPGVSSSSKFGNMGRKNVFVATITEKPFKIESLIIFGGSDDDFVRDISQDDDGNILVYGDTVSDDFPSYTKFGKNNSQVKSNLFLIRIDRNTKNVINSIVVRGNDYTYASKILLKNGDIFISGTTASSDFNFTDNGINNRLNKADPQPDNYGFDGFVLKFDGGLSHILASTYIGGNADDFIKSMIVDDSGRIILGGYTCSTDFPRTPGTYVSDQSYGGVNHFIMCISDDLQHMIKSMLFESKSLLYLQDVALGGDGSFWITGYCAYPGSIQTTKNVLFPKSIDGGYDGFIIHMKNDLKTILHSSFFGGKNNDYPKKIHITPDNKVILTGFTDSFNTFPVSTHIQEYPVNFGHYDSFVTVLNSDLSEIEYSSLFGGPGIDRFVSSAVYGNSLYLIGETTSGAKTFENLFLFSNRGKKHKIVFTILENFLSFH